MWTPPSVTRPGHDTRRHGRVTPGLLAVSWSLLLAWLLPLGAAAPTQIPEPLQPWVSWVLHDHTQWRCPHAHDAAKQRFCAWPGPLRLKVEATGGRFVQEWTVYAPSAVPLPGSPRHWPQAVTLDEAPAIVVSRGERPVVWLEPGHHRLAGRFDWNPSPASLAVPGEVGLVHLEIKGEPRPLAYRDAQGLLWLRTPPPGAPRDEHARIDLRVFRLLDDQVPQRLVTRLELSVSGPAREVVLPPPLPAGFTAYRLDAPLPARLERDGGLRMQLRPGRWVVELAARGDQRHDRMEVSARPAPWPGREVWSFRARPELRVVEIAGGIRVDPARAGVPQAWRDVPAFVLKPGEHLALRTVQRGARNQGPGRLRIERAWWLDFTGQGLTFRDRIQGTLGDDPRLVAGPMLDLGAVRVDGSPRLLTRLPGEPGPGVELRRGTLNVVAVGRVQRQGSELPANGWMRPAETVQATLHLPPGWRLLGVAGARAPAAWLERWTLLDLFLVMLVTVSAGRLSGWPWAVVAALAVGLTWHEPGAPRYLWLNLLLATALARWAQGARFTRWVRAYRWGSGAVLVLAALPFFVHQMRAALYPQLEYPQAMTMASATAPPAVAPERPLAPEGKTKARAGTPALENAPPKTLPAPTTEVLEEADPHGLIQTGPGVPRWRWVSHSLQLAGPVAPDQVIRPWLLPPAATRTLRIGLVALVVVLLWRLSGAPRPWRTLGGGPALGVLAAVLAVGGAPDLRAQDFPGAELLEQLGRRLTEPPRCLPRCAEIAQARAQADPGALSLDLEIHAAAAVAVPLPGGRGAWHPSRVRVDEAPAAVLRAGPDEDLWVALEAGVHRVVLEGPLPRRDRVQLRWPLVPRRLEVAADGWSVSGVDAAGQAEPTLALLREAPQGTEPRSGLEPAPLPGFARLERTLRLGLQWSVDYRLQRLSAADSPLTLRIPLLPGEAVITPDLAVQDGAVVVRLAPGQPAMAWRTRMQPRPELVLRAPPSLPGGGPGWFEIWRLEAAPLWHVTATGLGPIHRLDPAGRWRPQWRPWPGETVRVQVTRTPGAPGPTLTVDRAEIRLQAGERRATGRLELALRTSRGGTHTVGLPPATRFERAELDGRSLPVAAHDGRVTVRVEPGAHTLVVHWSDPAPPGLLLRTPSPDLGAPAVNLGLHVALGPERWVLAVGGPRLGPAVLAWGVLAVLLALAWVLARLPGAPLRTWQWALLLAGLTQAPPVLGLVVVGWLLAMGARARWDGPANPTYYNLLQGFTASLTVLMMLALLLAVQQGLLGRPDMQVMGNGSTATDLHWYQDRTGPEPPGAWILWAPLWTYRALMLAWALWLAFAVVGWLRWAWRTATRRGLWMKEA